MNSAMPLIDYLNGKIPHKHFQLPTFQKLDSAAKLLLEAIWYCMCISLNLASSQPLKWMLSPPQKNPAKKPRKKPQLWIYNHSITILFSAINSTGKIKSAVIIYHCLPLHIHTWEHGTSVTRLYNFSSKLLVILRPFSPFYFTLPKAFLVHEDFKTKWLMQSSKTPTSKFLWFKNTEKPS